MQNSDVNLHRAFPWYKDVLEAERVKVTSELANLDPGSNLRLVHLQGQLKALLDLERVFKKKIEEQYGIRM